jgi:hypothetical protein
MKILTISSNQLELARAQLRKPFVTIGRSPSCDVVLRAPGVQAIHFLIEWIGAGEFNPNQGVWSIADISQASESEGGTESAEGLVFAEKPIESSGFVFACIEDRLESAEQIGGKIVTNLAASMQGKSEILELIQVRTDSGAIEEVRHIKVRRNPGKERILPRVKEFKIEWCGKKVENDVFLKVLLEEMPGAEVSNRGHRVPPPGPTASLNVKPLDILRIRWSGRDFFIRLVDEVKSPPIPHEVVGDPLLRRLMISIGIVAFLLLLMIQLNPPAEKVVDKPPLRIARIEVPKPPEPPKPEPEVKAPEVPPAVEPPEVVEKTPPKEMPKKPKLVQSKNPPAKPKQEKMPEPEPAPAPPEPVMAKQPKLPPVERQQPAKPASPSMVKAPDAPPKAGLNSPAKVTDMNTVGILGALKKAGPKGPGVQANKIMNDAVVTESISGAEASRIVLKNPPTGTLGTGNRGSRNGDNRSNLSAASTTLSGVGKGDPNSRGAIAFSGQHSGSGLGSDLVAGGTSANGASSIGTIDGSEFSVEGGGLDRETVRRVIASYRSQVRTCYERALLTKSNLEGRISYDWRIGPDGVVITAAIAKSTLDSPNLASCVLGVIKKMVFPKAQNGRSTRVIYPFVFQGRR